MKTENKNLVDVCNQVHSFDNVLLLPMILLV